MLPKPLGATGVYGVPPFDAQLSGLHGPDPPFVEIVITLSGSAAASHAARACASLKGQMERKVVSAQESF